MNFTNKEILKPKIIGIETKETEQLFQTIRNDQTANAAIQCLSELLKRQEKQIQELKQVLEQTKQEIAKLNTKIPTPKKMSGRKQKEYFLNGSLVDDDELIRLIDGEFITISKLEKEVGAKKNVLRRRYERIKQRQK